MGWGKILVTERQKWHGPENLLYGLEEEKEKSNESGVREKFIWEQCSGSLVPNQHTHLCTYTHTFIYICGEGSFAYLKN